MSVRPSLRAWSAILSLTAALVLITGCPPSNPGTGGETPKGTGNGGTGNPTTPSNDLSTSSYDNWTTENTPTEYWTKRDDVPWVDDNRMVGESVITTEEKRMMFGEKELVLAPGTSLWWRRLKPGYDILTDKQYREDQDKPYLELHPGGVQHKYSGPGPFGENRMIIGTIGKWSNLNPILTQDAASSDIVQFVFSRLCDIDENWKPIPQLAEGFASSPDAKSYTYFLRKGAKFSNGTEITAHDVEFTYSKILDDNVLSPRKGDFVQLDRIEVLDDYTLTFHMKIPFAPFIRNNATYGIIPRAQFDLEENRDWATADFNKFPIGGGPYVFDKAEGDDVYLKANATYFGRKPALEQIIFKKTPGLELEQKQLESGEIDLGAIRPQDLDVVGKAHPELRQFRTAFGLGYSYMGFNHKSTFFKDLAVRQAIAHAVNRQDLLDKAINGHGALCNSNIPPMSPFYNPDTKGYDYDVEKAKTMLEAAGWKDTNGDGIREKDGRVFKFDLITNEGNPQRQMMAELIQSDLKLVGIDARPRLIEWSSFIEQFIHAHNFEAFILSWSLSVDPDDYSIFHSSQFDDGLNYGYYANSMVDELLVKGQAATNEAERKDIYGQIQLELARDLPYLFLMYSKKAGGAAKRMAGLPQTEPSDTSYRVPPMDASMWFAKGNGFNDGGPTLSPQ